MTIELRSDLRASRDVTDAGDQLVALREMDAYPEGVDDSDRLKLERQFQEGAVTLGIEVNLDNYLEWVMAYWKLTPIIYTVFPGLFERLLKLKNTQIRDVMYNLMIYAWMVCKLGPLDEPVVDEEQIQQIDQLRAATEAILEDVMADV